MTTHTKNQPLLATNQLSVQIGNKQVCTNLDSQFMPGQCWAVLGQNGTGKTTLLHTLAGLHPAQTGKITLRNTLLAHHTHQQRAQQLGLLLQGYQDAFPATVMETVLTGRHPHLSAWQWESEQDKAIAKQALKDVDLEGFENRVIQTLSGGERRRVAIAALLAQQTPCMLLDEPVNHLDIRHQHLLLKLVSDKALTQEQLTIMVLHDVNLATRYCSHALLMYEDGKIEQGKIEDVLTTEKLSQLYDYPLKQVAYNLFMPG